MNQPRRSGILLHPTSLPGRQPVGSLGPEAYAFVDFLTASGQSVWQLLPLGPTGYGHCPYSSFSAFAGNPLLLNLEQLVAEGDLRPEELPPPCPTGDQVDFSAAEVQLLPCLKKAAERFYQTADSTRRQAFDHYCFEQAFWLNDYAFFQAMRDTDPNAGWQSWPTDLRHRQQFALHNWGLKLDQQIAWHKYLQFVFFEQWFALKEYANKQGVQLFGDLPIFVAEESADLWANRHLFQLDEEDQPTLVAGVPPDYFSETGQRWGNPLYHWQRMSEDGYSWWRARVNWNLQLFDLVRIDHFRGFAACWAIPADEPTAINGSWQPAPGEELFTLLRQDHPQLPIIAEDLGVITPDVEALRDRFGFPGMKILQFAFDSGPSNPYLPHNHCPESVVYTGTHDNNTSLGWWRGLSVTGREEVREYLRRPCRDMPWSLIETALSSVARLAVIPMQDILSLDGAARMNRPGIATGNWSWRLTQETPLREITTKLRHVTHLYGRLLCNPTEMK